MPNDSPNGEIIQRGKAPSFFFSGNIATVNFTPNSCKNRGQNPLD